MGEASAQSGEAPWRGDQAPCVYCGRVIPRHSDRCPHCRTSFSLAVRRASREVVGQWSFLDPRNPSGRGVTFETLVKLIEKGRIQADSIIRGPPSHQDWTYAAEMPRLAKYLGICPHCFAEASPEQTYCTHCQLNMNERPAGARPGVPQDLVKQPHHKRTHEIEEELVRIGETAEEALPDEVVAPPTPTPTQAAAGELAEAAAAPRPLARVPRRRPKIWVILALTWATVFPLFLIGVFTPALLWFVPQGCEPGVSKFQTQWREIFGWKQDPAPSPAPVLPTPPRDNWENDRLREVDQAVAAGDYDRAIAIYRSIIQRTGNTTWQARIDELERRQAQQRHERLAGLRQKMQLAEQLANDRKFDEALAVLRNIGPDDRQILTSAVGVSVRAMEDAIQRDQKKLREAIEEQRGRLLAQLAAAKALRDGGKPAEALARYNQIAQTFPADVIAREINLAQTIQDVTAQIAAQTPPPVKPTEPVLTEKEIIQRVADLLGEAKQLEQEEKFAEALDRLTAIKKFDAKYWPERLEETIDAVRKKKEALEFFGMDRKRPPPG